MMLTFKKPSTKKILIFPSGSEINDNYLIKIFKKKNCEIYHGKEKVNFHIALDTILKFGFKNFSENYFKNYISITEPKYAATLNDLDKKFYKIKRINPKIILLSFQNGTRLPHQYKNLKGEKVDYYFTFGRYYSNLAKKSIKGKFIEIGSLRNNFFNYNVNNKKEILFTSVYKKYKNSKIPAGEIKILNFLQIFCKKYNYKLFLLGRHKYDTETKKKYQKNIKNLNCTFLDNKRSYETFYSLYKKFEIYIFERSTTAYEAISQGKKVVIFNFFSCDKKWYKNNDMIDRFPINKKIHEGFFWSHGCDYKKFEKKINQVINSKNRTWVKLVRKNMNESMVFDKNNRKLKEFLKKLSKR